MTERTPTNAGWFKPGNQRWRKMHIRRGEQCWWSKLTESEAAEIKRRAMAGEKQEAIAAEFGISGPMVSYIRNGKRWAHVS